MTERLSEALARADRIVTDLETRKHAPAARVESALRLVRSCADRSANEADLQTALELSKRLTWIQYHAGLLEEDDPQPGLSGRQAAA